MKKLLLTGCIAIGSISFASAQAADIDPNVAAKAQQKTAVKATNPQKAAIEAQDMSARGSKTKQAASTKGVPAKRRQQVVNTSPTDAAAPKKN